MRALFGKNVCENERIGSRWGGGASAAPPPLDPPMVVFLFIFYTEIKLVQFRTVSSHAKVLL